MTKLVSTVCIDASKEATWAVLAKLEDISLWSEPVLSASCNDIGTRGIGSVRTCNLKGSMTITEQIVGWNEGNSLTYLAFNAPMMKSAKNTWSVTSQGGKSLLTSEAELVFKGGIFGRLLARLAAPAMRKMSQDGLAAFKYLVEHGHAYEGKHSTLPRAPVGC